MLPFWFGHEGDYCPYKYKSIEAAEVQIKLLKKGCKTRIIKEIE